MELLQPYGKYILIGLAAIVGIFIVVWLVVAVRVMTTTKGIPQAISNFFKLIIENKLDSAYKLTTKNYQRQTSKKQFTKFINQNKFRQYKSTRLGIPRVTGDRANLDVTLILKSGREIPLKLGLLKQEQTWYVDLLEIDS